MVTILALLGVAAVLFVAAVLSTRDGAVLADAPRDAADVPLPDEPLTPDDVGNLKFSLAARGYRMGEVDLALERLASELADRDRRIALLEAAAQGQQSPPAVREATVEDLPAAAPQAVPPAPAAQAVPPAPAAPVAPAPTPPAPMAPAPPAPVETPAWLSTPSSIFPPTPAPEPMPAPPPLTFGQSPAADAPPASGEQSSGDQPSGDQASGDQPSGQQPSGDRPSPA